MSFDSGLSIGAEIGGQAYDAYAQSKDRAQKWSEMLSEKALAHETAAKALKTEADRYDYKVNTEKEETDYQHGRDTKSDILAADKEKATASHQKKEDDLLDAEIGSIKAGRGRYGTGKTAEATNLAQANKNLDTARKIRDGYTLSGRTPPDEVMDEFHAALVDVDRLSKNMGLNPADPSVKSTPKPGDDGKAPINWLQQMVGSNNGSGAAPTATAPRGKLRTGTINGQRVTEKFPGEWGP